MYTSYQPTKESVSYYLLFHNLNIWICFQVILLNFLVRLILALMLSGISQEWLVSLTWNKRDMNWYAVRSTVWPWLLTQPWPWPWIFKFKFWNICASVTVGLIDLDWRRYGSIGFWTLIFDPTHNLDLVFQGPIWNSFYSGMVAQLTWNEMYVNQ